MSSEDIFSMGSKKKRSGGGDIFSMGSESKKKKGKQKFIETPYGRIPV